LFNLAAEILSSVLSDTNVQKNVGSIKGKVQKELFIVCMVQEAAKQCERRCIGICLGFNKALHVSFGLGMVGIAESPES